MADFLRMATLSYQYMREEHDEEGWFDRNRCPMCDDFHIGSDVEAVLEYHVKHPPHVVHDTFQFDARADFDGQRTAITRTSEPRPIPREGSLGEAIKKGEVVASEPTEAEDRRESERAAARYYASQVKLVSQTYEGGLHEAVDFEPGVCLFYVPPTRWQRVKRWFKDQLRKVGILPKLREEKT